MATLVVGKGPWPRFFGDSLGPCRISGAVWVQCIMPSKPEYDMIHCKWIPVIKPTTQCVYRFWVYSVGWYSRHAPLRGVEGPSSRSRYLHSRSSYLQK